MQKFDSELKYPFVHIVRFAPLHDINERRSAIWNWMFDITYKCLWWPSSIVLYWRYLRHVTVSCLFYRPIKIKPAYIIIKQKHTKRGLFFGTLHSIPTWFIANLYLPKVKKKKWIYSLTAQKRQKYKKKHHLTRIKHLIVSRTTWCLCLVRRLTIFHSTTIRHNNTIEKTKKKPTKNVKNSGQMYERSSIQELFSMRNMLLHLFSPPSVVCMFEILSVFFIIFIHLYIIINDIRVFYDVPFCALLFCRKKNMIFSLSVLI